MILLEVDLADEPPLMIFRLLSMMLCNKRSDRFPLALGLPQCHLCSTDHQRRLLQVELHLHRQRGEVHLGSQVLEPEHQLRREVEHRGQFRLESHFHLKCLLLQLET